MVAISIFLPDEILEELEKNAESQGKSLEEFISETILKNIGISNPKTKAELHIKLCEKYLQEASELLMKKNYVQASEKAWGAASQIVKAIAVKDGKELRSHKELHEFIAKLTEKLKDKELGRLWRSATSLHQNFYENWFTEDQVKDGVEDVKLFVNKLKAYT
jgi:uncharacterized protein (UPF0332 family)